MATELFIENERVDITEDVVIPLNFAVAEIRDISKKKTSFSKTVKVPGTKRNNKLFGHYYDISAVTRPEGASGKNINVNFNQKKKADFLLLNDGASILSGTVELRSVDIQDGEITYNLVLFGELANLISAIGDKKLSDLTMNELVHDYTKENITGSWGRTTDYVYPLIDYGVIETRGEAYTVQSLRPAVYVKYYWDKIFEEAGFTYTSDFINSQLFQDLIIPYNKEGIEVNDAAGQTTTLSTTGIQRSGSATGSVIVTFPDRVYDVESADEFGDWDTSNLAFTSSVDQRVNVTYALALEVEYDYDENYTPPFGTTDSVTRSSYVHALTLVHEDASGVVKENYTDSFAVPVETVANGIEFETQPESFNGVIQLNLEAGDRFYFTLSNISTTFKNEDNFDIPATVTASYLPESSQATIQGASAEGGELTPSLIVPAEIKQRDLILNILRLFNLFMYEDPENPKQLIVEPRDDFYASGSTVDWTDKLDIGSSSTVETLDSSKVRTLSYKYKHDDNDYYLELYRNKWDKDYGERRVDTGYELNREEKDVLELDFGTATPIQYRNERQIGEVNIEIRNDEKDVVYVTSYGEQTNAFESGSNIVTDPPNSFPRFERAFIGRTVEILNSTYQIVDLISPWAFKVNSNVNTNAYDGDVYNEALAASNIPFFYNKQVSKVIPAILKSDDKLLTTDSFVSVPRILRYSKNIELEGNETFWIQDTPIESQTIKSGVVQATLQNTYTYLNESNKAIELTQYPFVSHVDDPDDPTFDLLFEQPEEVFWSISLT